MSSPTAAVTSRLTARKLALPLAGLLVTFAAGVLGGFVYAHEPAPPEVRAVLETVPVEAATEVRGTLTAIAADYIEVTTTEGARRLPTTRGMTVEQLVPAASVPRGVPANLGGNRTESGFVLTGVVLLSAAP